MRLYVFTLFLPVLCLWPATAWPASILHVNGDSTEVVISNHDLRPWEVNDLVCFRRQEQLMACGIIISSELDEAVAMVKRFNSNVENKSDQVLDNEETVELVFVESQLRPTDTVEYIPENTPMPADGTMREMLQGLINLRRSPATIEGRYLGKEDLLDHYKPKEPSDDDPLNEGRPSNLTFGINYIFPTVQYQQAVSDNYAPGLMPILFNIPAGNGSISGWGSFLTLTRYNFEPFHGSWIQAGVGFYKLTANDNVNKKDYNTPAVMANAGYRWFWRSGTNFGLGGGLQYIFNAKPSDSGVEFSGILPNVALDFGYAF